MGLNAFCTLYISKYIMLGFCDSVRLVEPRSSTAAASPPARSVLSALLLAKMLLATAQPVAREVDAVGGIGDDLADDPRLAAVLLENRQYEAAFVGSTMTQNPTPML